MIGQVVYTNELKVINGINPIEISVQNLKKGVYFFEYVTEKGKQTEKLVIE
ncbi:MAG: T9SS type A sorting domain-containing protein [Bacteroidetes bacterium]|nr:T9SS type A sorting domain-containing protein [Bacteroidota bacterium]